MLNFTVGPVQSDESICAIGAEQVPYFRTSEFSNTMYENENLMKKFSNAPIGSRAVFITGSGTASMEASIINTLTPNDKALIVNGGSFGQRFVDLCQLHNIPYTSIDLEAGKALTYEKLYEYNGNEYTAFLVNLHETSTGVLYNIDLISEFCKKYNLFLIVDAISSFLADAIDMAKSNIDVMITGSQKALACPPGISIIVLSPIAIARIESINCTCMYLDLKDALKNGERGQTPFTPAVGILRQINFRLKAIDACGGVDFENKRISKIATDFRNRIHDLPFTIASDCMSNAVTPLHPTTASAYDIFLALKNKYQIWICPNGGKFKDSIFRVGHIGNLTTDDNTTLINAFKDMKKQNII